MIDSFEKIRKIFHMFHGVLIPRSTLNHFCNRVAAELDPLYREIRRDLNAARLVNGGTTGWFSSTARGGTYGSLWEGTQAARRPCCLR